MVPPYVALPAGLVRLSGMAFSRSAAWAGAKDISPMMLGVFPFGLITGVSGVTAGLTNVEAVVTSAVVFAGAAQLAVYKLIGAAAPLIVIVATTIMINLRYVLYSASLAPYMRAMSLPTRSLLGALLADQAYLFSVLKFDREPATPRRDYFLGVAVSLWLVWMVATFIGVFLGTQVPESWSLECAIPLVFIALLVPAVKDRPNLVTALVAGGLAVAAACLPFNLGLIVAALCGIAAGALAERLGGRA